MLINSFPLKISTWANRPTTAQAGDLITITDVGPVDEVFKWTGFKWAPINGQCLLYSTNTSVSVTGTSSETELGSVTIPGGLMSSNGLLECSSFWTVTNSANTKTIKIKLGETSDPVTGGTAFLNRGETALLYHQHLMIIRNVNATNSQKSIRESTATGLGTTTLSNTTGSYDTTTDKKIFLTGQLANTGETITLRGWRLMYKE